MHSTYRGDPDQMLALNTFVKLVRAAESIGNRLSSRVSAHDLTASQFGVLEALYHLGPMHQCELAQRILKTSGNMTLVIDNLEKRGLVRRQRSAEDRRFIKVHLTDAGQELIAEIFPEHADAIMAEMSVLTPAEQRQLGQLCRKVGRQEASTAV